MGIIERPGAWEIDQMCEQMVSEIIKLLGPATWDQRDECIERAKQFVYALLGVGRGK